MKTLAERINEVASKMDGCFVEVEGIKIPHTEFVLWDDITGIIDDIDYYKDPYGDGFRLEPPTGEPTDEQIEAFIRMRETKDSTDEYYNDEIWEYVENHKEEEE